MKNRAFKVDFNDFGLTIIVAPDYLAAFDCFTRSGYGGKDVRIKAISEIICTNYPLVSLE